MSSRWRFISVIALAVTLSACGSLPQELTAKTNVVSSNYQAWLNQQGLGQADLRLGGVIAAVDNLADKTRLEIVNLPVDKYAQPDINREPQGRFVVYVQGFLEPITFSPGRLISVIGKPAGMEQGKVGEHVVNLPVMNAYGYRLWKIRERVEFNDVDDYFFPCHGLNCRGIGSYPRKGTVIKEVK